MARFLEIRAHRRLAFDVLQPLLNEYTLFRPVKGHEDFEIHKVNGQFVIVDAGLCHYHGYTTSMSEAIAIVVDLILEANGITTASGSKPILDDDAKGEQTN